jgi:hypothetical protein
MIQHDLDTRGGVLFEGVRLRKTKDGADLLPGDTYVAERNSGPKLLTVREINHIQGWIIPQENAYVFDIYECVGVEIADD